MPGLGQQTPAVWSATTAASAAALAAPDRDVSRVVVPGLLAPALRMERGDDRALPQDPGADTDQAGGVVPMARPGDTPFDQEASIRAEVLFQTRASDACFANGFWSPGSVGLQIPGRVAEHSGAVPGYGGAVAALALALGGICGTHLAETESRRRWGLWS
jgi:hypothetical protein